MEFHSSARYPESVPEDLTVPQFILDTLHESRPVRPSGVPWLASEGSGKTIGLEEIHQRTNGLAVSLRDEYFIGKNDVVLIFSSNHIDYPICVWAVHRLLGIIAPCNPAYTVPELIQVIELSNPTLIITHSDGLDVVDTAVRQAGISVERVLVLDEQDSLSEPPKSRFKGFQTIESLIRKGCLTTEVVTGRILERGESKRLMAFYSLSSGTTGPPKMVMISHYTFVANIIVTSAANIVGPKSPRFVPGDRCLAVLPFFHIYGLFCVLHLNFFAAISVIVAPRFNFSKMLDTIDRYKITTLMLVPPQLLLLVKEPNVTKYDLSHIRTVLSGAAPLTVEVYRLLTKLLPQAHICQAYGSTETSGIILISPLYPKHMRPNSSGALVPGVRARIVKPDGTLAGYDEEGELHVKTPAIATGYLNDEAATRATFLGDSWMRTGDLVKMDRSNEIVVVDRIKEMIKVRGFQVAPVELEGCILDHPMVTDVCVVGVPHLYSGEVPFAFVTISHEGQKINKAELKASIQRHIEKNKAPFKRLHYVEIIDSIPKTPSGKLLRRVLRQEARKLVVPSAKL